MNRTITISLLLASLSLAGCATGPEYGSGGYRSQAPIVSAPRVSGGTYGGASQGRASTVIGNSQTPARIHLNSRMTSDGFKVTPSIRSRFLNWSFR